MEFYSDTFKHVLDLFEKNQITEKWNGYKSFKYNFRGDFNKFKEYIQIYNSIKKCLNYKNLDIEYNLNKNLPIQIVNDIFDSELLNMIQIYYKENIKNTYRCIQRTVCSYSFKK